MNQTTTVPNLPDTGEQIVTLSIRSARPVATVHRRTFDALAHPPGTPERERLNCDPLHSQYLTGSPYLVRVPALMSDGTPNPAQAYHDNTFRTRAEADAYAQEYNTT